MYTSTTELRAQRTERLRQVKTQDAYKALMPRQRALVDKLERQFGSEGDGICVKQGNLARGGKTPFKFAGKSYCRETINLDLQAIVAAGVFTWERRNRPKGWKIGGRSSNVYRLNPSLLSGFPAFSHSFSDSHSDSGSMSSDMHVEAPLRGACRSTTAVVHAGALSTKDELGAFGASAFRASPETVAVSASPTKYTEVSPFTNQELHTQPAAVAAAASFKVGAACRHCGWPGKDGEAHNCTPDSSPWRAHADADDIRW
jgi:hypothetical protein